MQNGLLLVYRQWGLQDGGNNWDIYYPIAINQVLAIVAIDAGAEGSSKLQALGIKPHTSSFKIYSSGGNNFYLSWLMLAK